MAPSLVFKAPQTLLLPNMLSLFRSLGIGMTALGEGLFFLFFKCLFIYLLRERERERERDHEQGKSRREGDRGSEAGSVLTAESPAWGLNSQTVSQMLNRLSHPRALGLFFF